MSQRHKATVKTTNHHNGPTYYKSTIDMYDTNFGDNDERSSLRDKRRLFF